MGDIVLVAGAGRSGTTWLAELINCHHDYNYRFEPGHPFGTATMPNEWLSYIRPGSDGGVFAASIGRIFSGDLQSNAWEEQYNHEFSDKGKDNVLIKAIRYNLMIPYIATTFPHVKIVYIIRHPLAVVLSRQSINWERDDSLATALTQVKLMEDYLQPLLYPRGIQELTHPKSLSYIRNEFLLWCLSNAVPMMFFELQRPAIPVVSPVHVVFYEELCISPHAVMSRLDAFLGCELAGKELDSAIVSPSMQASPISAINAGIPLITDRSKDVSPHDLNWMEARLKEFFHLDRFYNIRQPMPLKTQVRNIQ